jgi:hypothetical protein
MSYLINNLKEKVIVSLSLLVILGYIFGVIL